MTLYYIHDPMCSWCWAFRPVLLNLLKILPPEIKFIRLLGGLAADSDEPMSLEMRDYIIGQWQRIQQQLPDTQFNYDFWTLCQPQRSTYPACRAVIAARQQGVNYDQQMTFAIQQAYYLHARNPSRQETLTQLASEIGLDVQRFNDDVQSARIDTVLKQEINQARRYQMNHFPSFLLIHDRHKTHIQADYVDAEALLKTIQRAQLNP